MGCCGSKNNNNNNNNKKVNTSLPVVGQPRIVASSRGRYVNERINICSSCEHNKGGVCEKISEKTNDYRASILHGVQRKSLACPVGKWKAVHVECMGCGRVSVVDEKCNRCKQCIQKKNTASGRSGIGKESIRHLCFYFSCETENAILYHLDRIDREIQTFNGKKVCYFDIADETLKKKYLPQVRQRFDKIVKGGSLCHLFSEFEKCSNKEVICFANSIKISEDVEVNNLLTGILYDTVFHNWQEVRSAMTRGNSCVGSFKNVSDNRHRWSFFGGFFWVRSCHIFRDRKWARGANKDFSKYLGWHIEDSSSHCIFGDWYDIPSKQEHEIIQDISLDFKKWNNNSHTN